MNVVLLILNEAGLFDENDFLTVYSFVEDSHINAAFEENFISEPTINERFLNQKVSIKNKEYNKIDRVMTCVPFKKSPFQWNINVRYEKEYPLRLFLNALPDIIQSDKINPTVLLTGATPPETRWLILMVKPQAEAGMGIIDLHAIPL